ncbi:hypothetical protein [Tateyamaria sp. SN6-1]|uniref:hypothetical protein n=1 Tax=Tateyamaria sp. SN6-1 TaxID=3092148 RepID=UPI0039F5C496
MRVWIALSCLLAGAACLPLNTFYAEGVSVAQLERDTTQCDVQALRDAPVANVVRQGPPRFVRGRSSCDATGKCHHSAGYWVPGEVYSVDVNADLRARVKGQCMADRGYAPVEIPACPAGVSQAAPDGRTTILPTLNEKTCVIRNQDGSIHIVQRG